MLTLLPVRFRRENGGGDGSGAGTETAVERYSASLSGMRDAQMLRSRGEQMQKGLRDVRNLWCEGSHLLGGNIDEGWLLLFSIVARASA